MFDLTAQDYFDHNEEMQEDTHKDRQTERKKSDSIRMIHTGTIWIDFRSSIPKDTSSLCNVASLHAYAICLGLSYVQLGLDAAMIWLWGAFKCSVAHLLCDDLHHARKC